MSKKFTVIDPELTRRVSKQFALRLILAGSHELTGKAELRWIVPQERRQALHVTVEPEYFFDYDYPENLFDPTLQFIPALRWPLQLAPHQS